MSFDHSLNIFVLECRELLDSMEAALLSAETGCSTPEAVNAIFRAAHTIKGSAGLFGLDHVVAFTHAVESVLDGVREGTGELNADLVELLLACHDHMQALVGHVALAGDAPNHELWRLAGPLLDQLRARALGALPENAVLRQPGRVSREDDNLVRAGDGHWHISLRFGADVLRNGMDPMGVIRHLEKIGRVAHIVTLTEGLPEPAAMDPETCYLGFEIAFETDADQATIEAAFEFVREDAEITILPPNSRISAFLTTIESLHEEPVRLGEILLDKGAIHAPVVDAALARQHQLNESKVQVNKSIRVDADKLDHLINLVGELIIAGASADLIARRAANTELKETTSAISALVEAVLDSALKLRMVKIGATFKRFQRVVHDAAREIGKDIELVVSGEDTELDKTVIEKIGDPLTHLVRNAIDHGIEEAEVRQASGKPAQGAVRLNAYHDSGSIVIEVSDDGGGLKRDKILAKAIERGLVEPGAPLSDRDICNLVFEPGFSTAAAITNLSGRGVGMDVVKRNIEALRGSVDIRSVEGAGSTISVRLPLTLAMIDGFLVGVGKSMFVIPLDMIEECIAFSAEAGHDYTNLRGEVLPFIRLRELFAVDGAPARRPSIVVVRHGGKKAGIAVDALLGEFQTVIKPLGRMFGDLKFVSGSSILGSGEVALILDVAVLFGALHNQHTQPLAA